MDKQDIIKTLRKYNLKDFIIISGASMVLQNIKETTNDIDISVSIETYNFLLKTYNCEYEKTVDWNAVWFIDKIINFSNNYYDKINYIIINGLKMQTMDSILQLKQNLNRDKDKLDISLIEKHLKSVDK